MCCLKSFHICKTPMETAVLVNRTAKLETLLDQRGAAQESFWLSSLAVVSFCSSQSKPSSVNLGNSTVNETSKTLMWLTIIKTKNLRMRNSPKKVLPGGITANITATWSLSSLPSTYLQSGPREPRVEPTADKMRWCGEAPCHFWHPTPSEAVPAGWRIAEADRYLLLQAAPSDGSLERWQKISICVLQRDKLLASVWATIEALRTLVTNCTEAFLTTHLPSLYPR